MSTADLWIQEKIRDGKMELVKILGTESSADIFTKYADKASMGAAPKTINLVFKDGESPMAPAIMGNTTTALPDA